jgi:hypothetical protein
MKKDLKYYKQNAEADYLTTPISVLRYIGELESKVYLLKSVIHFLLFLFSVGGILILNNLL